ncbi:hypothetical protein [Bacillus sp. T33-2]|uniref:hypothetical protein n=1 Tax=Bacillus sp. T33-2 TaxID=2054168 RepID=UPI000C765A4B|nr:hypothetical protein [Bacillus sp. T33-2]PLR92543.1 hypothetical protein CVD19_19985 [Bacillus sp. T33-2]
MSVFRVETKRDMERFDDIWIPVWIENEFELESYITPGVERFIFSDIEGDYGCVEFSPYNYLHAPVNELFPFHNYKELHNAKVFEFDKLAINPVYQYTGKLLNILSFIVKYLVANKPDYVIALLNPTFYEDFILKFNVPVTRLTSEKNDLKYIPVIMDSQQLINSKLGKRLSKQLLVGTT